MEDWTCLGQHKRHPEFPVVTRESRRNSRKTTWLPRHRKMKPFPATAPQGKSHVRNWRSKGHLAPLMRPTKFPEIPLSPPDKALFNPACSVGFVTPSAPAGLRADTAPPNPPINAPLRKFPPPAALCRPPIPAPTKAFPPAVPNPVAPPIAAPKPPKPAAAPRTLKPPIMACLSLVSVHSVVGSTWPLMFLSEK